ncbi:MAG TPA: anaerobic ribonucleoside-triphosphate reductase activating protein [bacterium]|nr:anaerobic ribonucleoside-triphosphate reductase activating protein [bacterium]HPP30347.1 anaerobic ribonucleoside-triphosphate reductase activating protein [bacterium]
MKIGALQKTSLIEFPGRLSCIVFIQGCNFRCPYCHNPELVLPEKYLPLLSTSEVIGFLEMRKKYLDGVVITGGEPCADSDLLPFVRELKGMGYAIKIDTNGSFPEVIGKMLTEGMLDYIAMDVKGPAEKYEMLAGVRVDMKKIEETISLIKNSSIGYEFRTTVVKEMLSINDFEGIGRLIQGAKLYYLQHFKPSKAVDPATLSYHTYSDKEFEEIKKIMLKYVERCEIR